MFELKSTVTKQTTQHSRRTESGRGRLRQKGAAPGSRGGEGRIPRTGLSKPQNTTPPPRQKPCQRRRTKLLIMNDREEMPRHWGSSLSDSELIRNQRPEENRLARVPCPANVALGHEGQVKIFLDEGKTKFSTKDNMYSFSSFFKKYLFI